MTVRLRSYRAAMKVIANIGRQEVGRHPNNRVENSLLPLRRRERAMSRSRRMSSLQKFASSPAPLHKHFNLDRHLNPRTRLKTNHDAALLERRQLLVAQPGLTGGNERRLRISLTRHALKLRYLRSAWGDSQASAPATLQTPTPMNLVT